MRTLSEIYAQYTRPDGCGDKGTAHTYIQEYEKLLAPYRVKPDFSLLEIGVALGLSMRMWVEYFQGSIVGVDIKLPDSVADLLTINGLTLIEADATKPDILHHLGDRAFDIIIDDGSHILEHQICSFNLLKSKMRPNGLYIIEDIQNIDFSKDKLLSLHSNAIVIDNRKIKNRHDDVLIVYKF